MVNIYSNARKFSITRPINQETEMKVRTNTKSGAACYTVQSGDSLGTIAQRFYGPSATYNDVERIYYSNMATIGSNPNNIYPGQRLYIPD